MALSLITLIAGAPSILGVSEAIRQGQQKDRREEHRARRCNLITGCLNRSELSRFLDQRVVVLKDSKLYLDTSGTEDEPFGHPFAGYFLPYPDVAYEGIVTSITDEAPIMNWMYVDRNTHEVKYGVRADAQPNLTGPFDCTRQDRRLTFDSWEGFLAVEENEGLWALYFDCDDDNLAAKIPVDKRRLHLDLTRRERRWVKDPEIRKVQQALQNRPEAPVEGDKKSPDALNVSSESEKPPENINLPSRPKSWTDELEKKNPDFALSDKNKSGTSKSFDGLKKPPAAIEPLREDEFININIDLQIAGNQLSGDGDDPLTTLQAQVKTQIDAQFRRPREEVVKKKTGGKWEGPQEEVVKKKADEKEEGLREEVVKEKMEEGPFGTLNGSSYSSV